MRSRALVFAALALIATGCGASEAEEALDETAERLGEIRSGELDLKVLAEGQGDVAGNIAGFELSGPFSIEAAGSLPIAKLRYTQIAGEVSETVEVISTGERAYVETGGTVYELPEDRLEEVSGVTVDGGLTELEVGDWFEGEPELSDGGEVGGASTDLLSSDFDLAAGLNDLVALAADSGAAELPLIEQTSDEQLARAVDSATIEVNTGSDDRLLRRLDIELDLGLEGVEELADSIAETGATISFLIEIDDVNQPVEVAEPEGAVPYPGG